MKKFLEWAVKIEQQGKGAFATSDQMRLLERFGFEFDSFEPGDPSVGIFGDMEVWVRQGGKEGPDAFTIFLAFDDNTWRVEQDIGTARDIEIGSSTMDDLGALRQALVAGVGL